MYESQRHKVAWVNHQICYWFKHTYFFPRLILSFTCLVYLEFIDCFIQLLRMVTDNRVVRCDAIFSQRMSIGHTQVSTWLKLELLTTEKYREDRATWHMHLCSCSASVSVSGAESFPNKVFHLQQNFAWREVICIWTYFTFFTFIALDSVLLQAKILLHRVPHIELWYVTLYCAL